MKEVSWSYNDGNGHITIVCENFFPASQNKLKQMLKIVDLTWSWDERQRILQEFHSYLMESFKDLKEKLPKIAEKYSISRTKFSEMQDNVRNCKKSNGVPYTKDELKQAKEDLKELKKEVNSLEVEFKTFQKKMQKTNVNAEIVKGWMKE